MDGWWVVRWTFSLFAGFRGVFRPFFHSRKKEAARRPPQTADKLFPGGLEGPQALQSGFVSPGFPRSLNRRGGRWPRPPLVSLPTFRSLCHLRWQQPTGLTLPSGAGRAGGLRPWAQTFLKHLAEKAAEGGLFRQAEAARRPPLPNPRQLGQKRVGHHP